jgi:hypothetical protein
MKVKTLIKKLAEFPLEANVVLMDHRGVSFSISNNLEGTMEIDNDDGTIDQVNLSVSCVIDIED